MLVLKVHKVHRVHLVQLAQELILRELLLHQKIFLAVAIQLVMHMSSQILAIFMFGMD
jgi:hypothetical protein